MTEMRIFDAIAKYRNRLVELDMPMKPYPNDLPLVVADPELEVDSDVLSHCHLMLAKIEQFINDGKLEKAFRWLGFIQGCLWCTGLYTINDMREDNR